MRIRVNVIVTSSYWDEPETCFYLAGVGAETEADMIARAVSAVETRGYTTLPNGGHRLAGYDKNGVPAVNIRVQP